MPLLLSKRGRQCTRELQLLVRPRQDEKRVVFVRLSYLSSQRGSMVSFEEFHGSVTQALNSIFSSRKEEMGIDFLAIMFGLLTLSTASWSLILRPTARSILAPRLSLERSSVFF